RLHRDGLAIASELGMWAEAADRLSGLGRIAMLRDDHNTARELHERARSSAAEHGFRAGEIYAVTGLGLTARRAGRLQDAKDHLLEAAAWYRRTGGAPGYATVLVELGHLAECNGGTGIAHFEEALVAARRIGDTRSEAAALVGVAGSQLREGRLEAAAERLDAAARLRGDDPVPPADRADLERITEAVRMPASTTNRM
ncbi:MAG: AfsR/SARP family transcriptional regulator, partial [Actinomycetes bacterium]